MLEQEFFIQVNSATNSKDTMENLISLIKNDYPRSIVIDNNWKNKVVCNYCNATLESIQELCKCQQ